MSWGFNDDEFGDDLPEEEGGPPAHLVGARNAWPEYLATRLQGDGYLLQDDEWVPDDSARQPEEDVRRFRSEYLDEVVFPEQEHRLGNEPDKLLSQIEDDLAFEASLQGLGSREQQRQRRIRSQQVQEAGARKAAEEAKTTEPGYGLLALAGVPLAIYGTELPGGASKYLEEEVAPEAANIGRKVVNKLVSTSLSAATGGPMLDKAADLDLPWIDDLLEARKSGIRAVSKKAGDVGAWGGEALTPVTLGDLALTIIPAGKAYVAGRAGGEGFLRAVVRAGLEAVALDPTKPGSARALFEGIPAPRATIPNRLYSWTPSRNVDSLKESPLRPASWLAKSPEEALDDARLWNAISTRLGVGEIQPGAIFAYDVDPNSIRAVRQLPTGRIAFRNMAPLPNGQIVPTPRGKLFNFSDETGAFKLSGDEEPLSELEQAMMDSLKMDKDDLLKAGKEQAEGVQAEMRARDATTRNFYRDTNRLRKKARNLQERLIQIHDEVNQKLGPDWCK